MIEPDLYRGRVGFGEARCRPIGNCAVLPFQYEASSSLVNSSTKPAGSGVVVLSTTNGASYTTSFLMPDSRFADQRLDVLHLAIDGVGQGVAALAPARAVVGADGEMRRERRRQRTARPRRAITQRAVD